jgi:diadenosine tetraphosphate (Ap4A) HIT family hydrolase
MLYKDFQKQMTKCPFCSPLHNRAVVSYESAFLTYALAPYHPHHLLVIPRRHVESFLKLNVEESEEINGLLRYGVRLLHAYGYKDCTILVRDGMGVGKSVRHLHYHIIPNIRIGDLDHYGQERTVMTNKEIRQVIRDLQQAQQKIKQPRPSKR